MPTKTRRSAHYHADAGGIRSRTARRSGPAGSVTLNRVLLCAAAVLSACADDTGSDVSIPLEDVGANDGNSNRPDATVDATLDVVPDVPSGGPQAPVLETAEHMGGVYRLRFSQPGSAQPAGGYDTYINGDDQNDTGEHSGLERTLTGLSGQRIQCFTIEARFTQLDPPVFLVERAMCVAR